MSRKEHWNQVYAAKPADEVSWFQTHPATSLRLIAASGVAKDAGLIDVGGGASVLVDRLVEGGFAPLAVVDLSAAALDHARRRLGERARQVEWMEADITSFVPPRRFGLWHDRAVFHFLTAKTDRQKYVAALRRTLAAAGQVIIATFAADGPVRCSGLEVVRYDAPALGAELGPEFELLEEVAETHVTPWNTEQKFAYFRLARKPRDPQ